MSGETHYPPQHQHQSQWPQQPHLLPPLHTQSSFPSPSSPSSSLSEQQHYPPYYQQTSQQSSQSALSDSSMVDNRPSTSLSLNLSSLSVTSPTNLSPIHPSVSPITPISPSNAGLHQNTLAAHHTHHHHSHVSQPFQFAPPDHNVRYDDSGYDYPSGRRLTSSRSSSSSDKSVPRKRSFTSGTSLPPPAEESAATPVSGTYDHTNGPMDTSPYDEVEMSYSGMDAEGSPIDGSNSGGEQDDQLKPLEGHLGAGGLSGPHPGSTINVLGKPIGTNNFVTKLYQMINDPKSAQFITWTELGTSFVVSNVGEFSRTILGSHFKHNNFSSFVRQLNMYGFHKINRTPRAQRTSGDAQTWEFSHPKFLRGRPDLLEEIKRKALEPDPSLKHRVELPGEVAAQLSQMRDDNRRLIHALNSEKMKVDRLANVTKALYDVVTKVYGQHINVPFPHDILDNHESPNILVTSPTASVLHSQYQPPLQSLSNNASLHSLHSLSPGSSPTAPEFPSSHSHTPHSLSRQHSFQHIQDYGQHSHLVSNARYESGAMSATLPPSPASGDMFDDAQGRKRQRTGGSGDDSASGKKGSRARSDSAPLGYQIAGGWPQTRPRSGSGLQSRVPTGRRDDLPVPNIASVSRTHHGLPTLSIPGGIIKQPPSAN